LANVTANTDANGKYIVQWPPPAAEGSAAVIPTIVSVLTARDPARNLGVAQYLYATNTHVDVHLSEGLSLSGSVKDSGGKPLNGCNVSLTLIDANYSYTLDQGTTDAEGSFNFRGLPQEDGYRVYVNAGRAGGYGVAHGTLEAAEAHTNRYAFPAFVLKKADRKLAGYVLDGNTKLLAGAIVTFSGEGQLSLPFATTDQQGYFVFDGVCEGPIKVFVRAPFPAGGGVAVTLNEGRGQDVRGGDTNLVLKLGGAQPDGEAR
jgi:hypothetical protein